MINDTEAVEEVEEVQAEEVQAEAPASLTVQDLANLRNIVDVASQRGAFKPAEFTMVGEAYTKLANFIQAITPPAPAAEEAVAEEAPEAEAAE